MKDFVFATMTALLVADLSGDLLATPVRDLSEPALFSVWTEGVNQIGDDGVELGIKSDKRPELRTPDELANKVYAWSVDDPVRKKSGNGRIVATARAQGGLEPGVKAILDSTVENGALGDGGRGKTEATVIYRFEVRSTVPLPPVKDLAGWVHIRAKGGIEFTKRSGDMGESVYASAGMLIPEAMTPAFPPFAIERVASTVDDASWEIDQLYLLLPGKYSVGIGALVQTSSADHGEVSVRAFVDPLIEIAPQSEGLFEIHISSNLDGSEVPEPRTTAGILSFIAASLLIIRRKSETVGKLAK